MNPNNNNINHGMFFFTSENGELKPLVEIKSIETSMVNPQCEIKCVADATVSFSATMNVSEETESALWAMAEGLEITKGD